MLMLNQMATPQISFSNPILQRHINTYGSMSCNGTYLNSNDYFTLYIVEKKSKKKNMLEIFQDEITFDLEDEIAAENEIKRLKVKKQRNFYNKFKHTVYV